MTDGRGFRPSSEAVVRVLRESVPRLNRWRVGQAEIEIESGLPLIRSVFQVRTLIFVEFLESLSRSDALSLLKARIRGEGLSAQESALIAKLEAFINLGGGSKTAAVVFPGVERGFVKRRELEPIVVARMNAALGTGSRTSRAWQWLTSYAGLTVVTYVDFGGRSQMTYQHNIYLGTDPKVFRKGPESSQVMTGLSLLRLLGVHEPSWDMIGSSEAASAATALVQHCERFLSAVPEIFCVDGG